MPTETIRMLDRVAKKLGNASDYRVAQELKVTRQTVSHWRKDRNYMSDPSALRCAEILGEPPGAILALIASDRTDDPASKKQWTNMARTLKASAAAVSLAALGFTMFPDAQARTADLGSAPGMYIMSNYVY